MSARNNCALRVGLTGGIASGKSAVAGYFAELGVPIIDTDIIAREVVARGRPALEKVARRFGCRVINGDGSLNRRAVRTMVFADAAARADLEAILHPIIGQEVRRQSATANEPYQIIVVPLLVDSPLLDFVDRVLVVDCEEQLQIERLIARDVESVEQAQRMLAAQSTREQRNALADDIIVNDADLKHLHHEVIRLDAQYRQDAARQCPHGQ